MEYNKNIFLNKIEKINSLTQTFSLPQWEELPNLELYMDQVIILLSRYLKIYSTETDANKFITPPMINNYVKLKIMPAPIKKKYAKIHMAYLIIICSLKQTLSMSTIQRIIPSSLEESRVKEIYTSYINNFNSVLKTTQNQINTLVELLPEETYTAQKTDDIIIQSAISSNLTKLITDYLIDVPNK